MHRGGDCAAKGAGPRGQVPGVPVHLVGMEFSKETRNVERFETELA